MEWRCYRWNCLLAPPVESATRKFHGRWVDFHLTCHCWSVYHWSLDSHWSVGGYTVSYFRTTRKISLITVISFVLHVKQMATMKQFFVPNVYSTMIHSVGAGLRTWNLRWCWHNCWLFRTVSLSASWLRWFVLVGQFSNRTTFAVIQTVLFGNLRKPKKGESSLTLNSY